MVLNFRLLFVFTSVFFTLENNLQKNYFEGIISYSVEALDKSKKMTKDESIQYIGDKQIYFIKENKYKTVMNGLLKITQFYTGKDTLYNTMQGSNALVYISVLKQNERVISFDIKKNQSTILGLKCDVLSIKTNDSSMKYYFNKDIKVNKELYKNHKTGLWYFCLNKTDGALPLKWVTDSTDSKLTIEAEKIDLKKLNDSIFKTPKNLPLVKSQ